MILEDIVITKFLHKKCKNERSSIVCVLMMMDDVIVVVVVVVVIVGYLSSPWVCCHVLDIRLFFSHIQLEYPRVLILPSL